jgi:hypothetical protein
MVSPSKVEDVRRLLAQGMSQRRIACQLGVSRGTVGGIASGKRPNYALKIHEEPASRLPAIRCRGCGGLVHPPCRLCKVREQRACELAGRKGRRSDFMAAAG